jgi:ABC-2 type transport system permease protein
MRRALRMEWTKLGTDPGTRWWALALFITTVGGGVLAASTTHGLDCAPRPCTLDAARISLSGVWIGQIAAVVLAVLAAGAEFESMMIRTTLAAVPWRTLVVAAKGCVVAAAVAGVATAGLAATLVVARILLPTRGFTGANGYPRLLSLAAEPTRRAYLGSVAYLILVAVLGLGVTLAVRHTGAAISTVLGLLYGAPVANLFITDPAWQHRIRRYSPMMAGLSIQDTVAVGGSGAGTRAIAPWTGLGVLAAYAALAVLVGALLFHRRDA